MPEVFRVGGAGFGRGVLIDPPPPPQPLLTVCELGRGAGRGAGLGAGRGLEGAALPPPQLEDTEPPVRVRPPPLDTLPPPQPVETLVRARFSSSLEVLLPFPFPFGLATQPELLLAPHPVATALRFGAAVRADTGLFPLPRRTVVMSGSLSARSAFCPASV